MIEVTSTIPSPSEFLNILHNHPEEIVPVLIPEELGQKDKDYTDVVFSMASNIYCLMCLRNHWKVNGTEEDTIQALTDRAVNDTKKLIEEQGCYFLFSDDELEDLESIFMSGLRRTRGVEMRYKPIDKFEISLSLLQVSMNLQDFFNEAKGEPE